jgi:molybdate transport system substrate-binding protein
MGDTANAIPQRLQRGEPIDVVIMVGDALEGLIQQGQVDAKGHRTLALSKISMAVRAGATPPDISSVAALKQALLQAKSVAYSDSASGEYLSKVLFPQLGLADALRDKGHKIPAEPVGQVVARGEAELGFQQTAELLPIAGITIVGEIPPAVQQVTPFAAGIVSRSSVKPAAQALIDYLSSEAVAARVRQTGLVPATVSR